MSSKRDHHSTSEEQQEQEERETKRQKTNNSSKKGKRQSTKSLKGEFWINTDRIVFEDETVEIHHFVSFENVKVEEVYEALVNEKILNEWKHGKVKMKKEVGSNFEICDWNGEVCGQIVELVPNEKIVEKWRLKTFPEGHYSEVEMRLRLRTRTKTKARTNENSENDGKDENEEQETIVEVIQRGVPLSFASNVSKFWFKFYWDPLEKFLKNRQLKQTKNTEVLVPNHIEIPVQDMKRAMKFYSDGFGWKTQKTNFENYVLWTSEGVGGGLFQSKGPIVSNKDSTVHFAVTPSDTLDSTVERLVGLGAKLKEKIEVPKTGWSAIMEDTEGNVFVIWKPMKDFHQQ